MGINYKNPISPVQLDGAQSINRTNSFGVSYSVNSVGGYMEVYTLSDLQFIIPSGSTGPIEYSGNTIPISYFKGSGTVYSPDSITLNSDNISSGRRRLGMLVYVHELSLIHI